MERVINQEILELCVSRPSGDISEQDMDRLVVRIDQTQTQRLLTKGVKFPKIRHRSTNGIKHHSFEHTHSTL
jgi:hypothetical protein